MDLTLLSGLLATLGSFCGLLFAVLTVRRMNKKLDGFTGLADSIGSIFSFQEDEEGGILVNPRMAALVSALSTEMAKSLKMSILGGLSGQARMSKGLKGAIAQDIVEQKMPLLNALGDVVGFNTKQFIAKNPDALGQLLQLAEPLLKNVNLGGLIQGNGGQLTARAPGSGRVGYG